MARNQFGLTKALRAACLGVIALLIAHGFWRNNHLLSDLRHRESIIIEEPHSTPVPRSTEKAKAETPPPTTTFQTPKPTAEPTAMGTTSSTSSGTSSSSGSGTTSTTTFEPNQSSNGNDSSSADGPAERETEASLVAPADEGEKSECSRLLLLLPDRFAVSGHGCQINNYLMGSLYAAFLDRAFLLVEPPPYVHPWGQSQFGCPPEQVHKDKFKFGKKLRRERRQSRRRQGKINKNGKKNFTPKDFPIPLGFSRLVKHPRWMSRGCEIPVSCGADKDHTKPYKYEDWKKTIGQNVTCITKRENADGSTTTTTVDVVVHDGMSVREIVLGGEPHEYENFNATIRSGGFGNEMLRHDGTQNSIDRAYRWAHNLGATAKEATHFASVIKDKDRVIDYVAGLINREGFLVLQPWIERDVDSYLQTFDLPLDEDYAAIHVRRGDKLRRESKGFVEEYWKSQGYNDTNEVPRAEGRAYIPFAHYLEQWDGPEWCPRDATTGEPRVTKHNVYVATDDPKEVRQEIRDLPGHIDDDHPYTVLWNTCYELRFHFTPEDETSKFHAMRCNADCSARYHCNIVSMADLMVLVRAKRTILEYNSNWGRLVHVLRIQMGATNTIASDVGSAIEEGVASPFVLDTRKAWGNDVLHEGFPGV